MGIRLPRRKKAHMLLSVIYRTQKLLPISAERKLRLFLDLEWIFERLALESSFKVYSFQDHPIRQHALRSILSRIEAHHTVLDLGCKTGDLGWEIAGKAAHVVGIDHDSQAIETALRTRKRSNLEFHCTDALDFLKKNDRKFNVLILSHILEHLDDPKDLLNDFKDFFELIYIELPDFEKSYMNQYRKDLASDLIYSDDDHVTEFDRNELAALVQECGLEILEREYRFGMQRIWCRVN